MFVFVDEAGDMGFKLDRGSSPCFTISLVIFSDESEMHRCDRRISELRGELGKPEDFEFHFHSNSRRACDSFLAAVNPFGFVYYTFTLNKSLELLRGDVFKNKETFYMAICQQVFELARTHIKDAYVVIDKSGSRDFQSALSKFMRNSVNTQSERIIRKFRAERSSQNNLLQLADYVASICQRQAVGKKSDAEVLYRRISLKEIQFKKWP